MQGTWAFLQAASECGGVERIAWGGRRARTCRIRWRGGIVRIITRRIVALGGRKHNNLPYYNRMCLKSPKEVGEKEMILSLPAYKTIK